MDLLFIDGLEADDLELNNREEGRLVRFLNWLSEVVPLEITLLVIIIPFGGFMLIIFVFINILGFLGRGNRSFYSIVSKLISSF